MERLSQAPAAIQARLSGLPFQRSSIGLSGAGVLIFDRMVLKVSHDDPIAQNEARMMVWLNDRLPVPQVLHTSVKDGRRWLLMSRLEGTMACDERFLTRPQQLLPLLCGSLRALWQVDTRDCPSNMGLDAKLQLAEQWVREGRCEPDDAEEGTFGPGGFRDPEHLLCWLKDHRPPEDLVLSHGDLCLPNLFFTEDRLAGFLDLGLCGLADRYQDLALLWRSLLHNTHGHYGQYPAFPPPDALFDALGLTPDRDKLRYYLLLDELF